MSTRGPWAHSGWRKPPDGQLIDARAKSVGPVKRNPRWQGGKVVRFFMRGLSCSPPRAPQQFEATLVIFTRGPVRMPLGSAPTVLPADGLKRSAAEEANTRLGLLGGRRHGHRRILRDTLYATHLSASTSYFCSLFARERHGREATPPISDHASGLCFMWTSFRSASKSARSCLPPSASGAK